MPEEKLLETGKIFWVQPNQEFKDLLKILIRQNIYGVEASENEGVFLVKINDFWLWDEDDYDDSSELDPGQLQKFLQEYVRVNSANTYEIPIFYRFLWKSIEEVFPGWTQTRITEKAGQLRLPNID